MLAHVIHTCLCMHVRALDFPMHIAFLLLALAFAHVLVSPAINNMENVLYIVAEQYMCYTGLTAYGVL